MYTYSSIIFAYMTPLTTLHNSLARLSLSSVLIFPFILFQHPLHSYGLTIVALTFSYSILIFLVIFVFQYYLHYSPLQQPRMFVSFILRLLSKGCSILIFPQGTFSNPSCPPSRRCGTSHFKSSGDALTCVSFMPGRLPRTDSATHFSCLF